MMKEVWVFYTTTYNKKDGYRQYYVSNWGRVMMNGELYECRINNHGYYVLGHIPLHRIIAERFIPNPDNKPCVDHINTNKLDNRVDNLRWCTHKENSNNPLTLQHLKEAQNNPIMIQHKIENSTPKKPVLQYTLDNKLIAEFPSTKEAFRQTKIPQSHIVHCCKHRYKSAGGYIWKYKNI